MIVDELWKKLVETHGFSTCGKGHRVVCQYVDWPDCQLPPRYYCENCRRPVPEAERTKSISLTRAEFEALVKEVRRPVGFPKIVCLCGSTRFVDHFTEWQKRLTVAGNIVLSIEIVTTQTHEDDPQHCDPELKVRLDELHLRKIDLADEVVVLNVGGYIGESTRKEIEHAKRTGKGIVYLEKEIENIL